MIFLVCKAQYFLLYISYSNVYHARQGNAKEKQNSVTYKVSNYQSLAALL